MSIDDDVLTAAKAMARQEEQIVGEVLSDLARCGLHRPAPRAIRNGVPLLARREGAIVTVETVNALRDGLP